MTISFSGFTLTRFESHPWHVRLALVAILIFSLALFRTVALTNVSVLALVLIAPFAWRKFYKSHETVEPSGRVFLLLVVALCVWDVITNLIAGHGLGMSLQASAHDMRALFFVVVLWALFSNPIIARFTLVCICGCIVAFASINLFLTLVGFVPQGQYFCESCSHLSHMYGQALVGVFFVLAQIWLVRPKLSWRVWIPMVLLVLSLFLASERRTGYILLLAGFALWGWLNAKRFHVKKYKWVFGIAAIAVVIAAATSGVVHKRMAQAWLEVNEYLAMTPQERAGVAGAVRIRMQYVSTVIEVIKQSNWWVGIGSIDFPIAYQKMAIKMGLDPNSYAWTRYNWSNPHNEYIFMLVTKGVVGLMLYLSVFIQACRLAWEKKDEIQRVGLIMFVFLFMFSITTNSMIVDMEEGHFAMLILLIFLAPKSLALSSNPEQVTRI